MQPYAFIALFLFPSPVAQARATQTAASLLAPTHSETLLTVEDAVEIASKTNFRVHAAALDIAAGESGVRSARSLSNPSANFTPGITSISGTGEEFLIQQPLEINGARNARAGIARAQLNALKAAAVSSLRDLVFRVKSAYYELSRVREQARVAREGAQIAQEFDRIARRQVEEGVRAGVDLAQTGLEVARAERQVILADGQVASASAALNALLGREPSTAIEPLTPLAELTTARPQATAGAVNANSMSVTNQALAARSEIRVEESRVEEFRQEARLARAEGRPDIAPQFRVGYFTRGLESARDGNGAGIGLAVTLPFLDYGSRRNRIRQAEQSASAQDARVSAVKSEVEQEVSQALSRGRTAEAIVQSYQTGTLDQARTILDGSRVGFREGRTNVLALLEAQRSFQSVQSEYVNALADAAIARAELERAVGSLPFSLLPTSSR